VFSSIGLILKQGDPRIAHTLRELSAYLHAKGLQVFVEENCVDACADVVLPTLSLAQLSVRCDLIIAIGGDGTMLQAARTVAHERACLLGINLGRLGFLTDIVPERLHEDLGPVLDGEYFEEERFLIQAEAYRGTRWLCEAVAFNDVVIHKWNMTHLFTYTTHINGHLLSSQRADGLIVSTPTGSTAYALSGGGPLLHPGLNALLLVSMCPHSLSNRPIVLDGDSIVEVFLPPDQPCVKAQMTCDGEPCQTLSAGDRIVIKKHRYIRLVHPLNYDHYARWRAKLSWARELDGL
jgi:NAD+ kinase